MFQTQLKRIDLFLPNLRSIGTKSTNLENMIKTTTAFKSINPLIRYDTSHKRGSTDIANGNIHHLCDHIQVDIKCIGTDISIHQYIYGGGGGGNHIHQYIYGGLDGGVPNSVFNKKNCAYS